MTLPFLFAQALTGLAAASSLFLVASGLSVIFGVTRIVNFAHGAFYMLGAYGAYSLTERWGGPLGFWGGIAAAALAVAMLGALVEIVILRRLHGAAELFPLLATFGLTLAAEDAVVLGWGAEDLVGRRAPGLAGAVSIGGETIPTYDLFLIALGPIVLGLLWLLFRRTRFGVLVRAATENRTLLAALGVDERWLFTGVFALGTGLAALGGALQLPRDAVNHGMDLRVIVEVFAVVVIGGLGSLPGAFVAAVLVAELNAFGILLLPGISLVLIFVVMAAVLAIRPQGLFGEAEVASRSQAHLDSRAWHPLRARQRIVVALCIGAAACLPLVAGPYLISVASELLIFALFAASLQFGLSVGGLVSFGHAAPFGFGAYGAALAAARFGLPMLSAIGCGLLLGLAGSLVFGWFCVRRSGVYLAMLTLACAQIAWSTASQWVTVTGGDNGVLGVWPPPVFAVPSHFYWLTLAVVAAGIGALRALTFSPFGYALRACRDSPLRAEAIGIKRRRVQWAAVSLGGTVAALAGVLFAFLKGSVFPDVLAIPQSVDGLAAVLLGGAGTISGGVAGAIVFRAASIWLSSHTDLSRLVLGLGIVVLAIACPRGLVGSLAGIRLKERVSP